MTAPESRRCVDIVADVMAAERDDHGQPIGEHPELAAVARVETPAELACREIREMARYWQTRGIGCGDAIIDTLDRLGA